MTHRGFRLHVLCVMMLVCILSGYSFAQKEQSLCEVTVTAVKPERFMVGQKVKEADSSFMAQNQFTNLSQFLQYQAPIAFRNYGAGQMASISFRGTPATHTAVLWNGININFPSLGQSDFSTLPLTGFDEMSIQYGSAASCVGTDAVGGSVLLKSVPKFHHKGIQAVVGGSIESSQNYDLQTGLRFAGNMGSQWKISGKTLLYGSVNNNYFGIEPIKNRKGRQYPVEPIQTRQNGWVQDLFALKNNGNLLSLNIWLSQNNVTIQPQTLLLREITNTQAQRLMLAYNHQKTLLRVAYINDKMLYGRGENLNPSHFDISRFIFRTEHDLSWIKNCDHGTQLKIGAEVVHFDAAVDGYDLKKVNENRADFYALLRHQQNSRLSGSLNLRQALVQGFNPPFTPSIGIDYRIFDGPSDRINLSGNLAYSYRVPTLNERYWAQLGDPNLKPEVSFNKEIGLSWKRKTGEKIFIENGISAFHNLIDNWTYWNPDKNFKVENLQQVLAKGIELESRIMAQTHGYQIDINTMYAFTHSSQQKAFGAYSQDILGKQLIYVPKHTLNQTLSIRKNAWSITTTQMFNSRRHVTFDHSGLPFPAYYILNGWINYRLILKKQVLNMQLQGNNLTNTLYPNLKKNAMPMRSTSLNILIYLNK